MIKLPTKRPNRAGVVLTWLIAAAFCALWMWVLAVVVTEAVS